MFLALIHNNNVCRNSYIRPQLTKLSVAMSDFDVKMVEISFQGVVEPHSYLMALARDLIYFNLSRKWHFYRLLSCFSFLLKFIYFLKCSVNKYIVCGKALKSWMRKSAIEVAVTEKHTHAWSNFLNTSADWFICFEDDAIFKDDSIHNLEIILKKIEDIQKPIYIDLAGGLNLEELKVDNLLNYKDDFFRYYKKPVTNTACVYMMNRALAYKFHALLTTKPWLRLIGIDWLINNLFIFIESETSNHSSEIYCIHAEPTIFKHGTTTGDYTSWQLAE